VSSSLTAGLEYQFFVVAFNFAGESGDSPVLTVKAADPPTKPDAPYKIFADTGTIQVGWVAPSSNGNAALIGYKLYWNGGGAGPLLATPLLDTADPAVFSHTENGLTLGERYTFAVAAYNEIDDS